MRSDYGGAGFFVSGVGVWTARRWGPFGPGRVLRRLWVRVGLSGAGTCQFGVGIGGCLPSQASEMGSVTPVLGLSSTLEFGFPYVVVPLGAGATEWFEFYPGVRFRTGANWIIAVLFPSMGCQAWGMFCPEVVADGVAGKGAAVVS